MESQPCQNACANLALVDTKLPTGAEVLALRHCSLTIHHRRESMVNIESHHRLSSFSAISSGAAQFRPLPSRSIPAWSSNPDRCRKGHGLPLIGCVPLDLLSSTLRSSKGHHGIDSFTAVISGVLDKNPFKCQRNPVSDLSLHIKNFGCDVFCASDAPSAGAG